jgi:hypothetical protein
MGQRATDAIGKGSTTTCSRHPKLSLGRYSLFELESARVMNNPPRLILRATCDISDSHTDKTRQPHASVAAAAFAKVILLFLPSLTGERVDTTAAPCLHAFGVISLPVLMVVSDVIRHVHSPIFVVPFVRVASFANRPANLNAIHITHEPTPPSRHQRTGLDGVGGTEQGFLRQRQESSQL